MFNVITIWTIVAGLCTSLALGAQQIVADMQRLEILNSDLDEECLPYAATWCIVIITTCATASVITGINFGIKHVSLSAFILDNFLLCVCIFLDMQWIMQALIVSQTTHI